LADNLDHVVLFSGDGDFRVLVEAIQRKGVRVSVVSTIRSQPPMIADELRRQADNFIDLEDLRGIVGREQRSSGQQSDDRMESDDYFDEDERE
ncbi:MAG: NYN domain-containing protein, partial [Pseudomonadota bacterium]